MVATALSVLIEKLDYPEIYFEVASSSYGEWEGILRWEVDDSFIDSIWMDGTMPFQDAVAKTHEWADTVRRDGLW